MWCEQATKQNHYKVSKKRRKKGLKTLTLAVDELEESTDDRDFEQSTEREVLIHSIIAEVSVLHPIHYNIYDLRYMYKQKKLSVFKVAMLKEICEHFEFSFKSKDKK